MYFLARGFCGELTIENATGAGPDDVFIRDARFLTRQEMADIVLYSDMLRDGLWGDLAAGFPFVKWLGVQEGVPWDAAH